MKPLAVKQITNRWAPDHIRAIQNTIVEQIKLLAYAEEVPDSVLGDLATAYCMLSSLVEIKAALE